MARTLRVVLVALAACFMLLSPGPRAALAEQGAAPDAGNMGQVTADGVKLRAKPDTGSEVLAEVSLGTEVEVLENDSGWYRVLYEGSVVGYIRQDYLFVNSMGSRGAYVLDDGATLRGGPSDGSYVVAQLSAGQGVKVKALIGEWYFAVADNKAGYIHRTHLMITGSVTASVSMLKTGMEGTEVKRLQTALYNRGFLVKDSVTGTYGEKTRAAVLEFQKACGLSSADGIAGPETLNSIYDSTNKVEKATATYNKLKGTVILLGWFEGGDEWLHKGAKFTVTDVRTGLSFRVRRFGGWYHADCEPITAYDTAIMKEAAGGKWTWDRRPIWVTYDGKTVAASMHSMPHMVDPTASNNFDGHFCIHLKGSKVHETSAECPRHQACVYEAYKKGRG